MTLDSRAPTYVSSDRHYILGYALIRAGVGLGIINTVWFGVLTLAVEVRFVPVLSWRQIRTVKVFWN
jgi:hypothetical protein